MTWVQMLLTAGCGVFWILAIFALQKAQTGNERWLYGSVGFGGAALLCVAGAVSVGGS